MRRLFSYVVYGSNVITTLGHGTQGSQRMVIGHMKLFFDDKKYTIFVVDTDQ